MEGLKSDCKRGLVVIAFEKDDHRKLGSQDFVSNHNRSFIRPKTQEREVPAQEQLNFILHPL